MKQLEEGSKSKSVCDNCRKLVDTTMKFRNVPFSDGSGQVESILAGVCDSCDRVVSVPHQSTGAIKNAIEEQKNK